MDLMFLTEQCDWPASLARLRAQHPHAYASATELNVTNDEGWNPLMICLCYGAPAALIKEILHKSGGSGAKKLKDKLGMTPLHIAARNYQGSYHGAESEDRLQIFR